MMGRTIESQICQNFPYRIFWNNLQMNGIPIPNLSKIGRAIHSSIIKNVGYAKSY